MTSVSIALCTYNGERFLPQLLASLLRLDPAPSELVACDDVSSDRTVELLEGFAEIAPFPVRIVRNERNLGATANFEYAMSLCTGDLIAFCDQDDVWYPNKLGAALAAFEAQPDIGFSFSDADLIDDDGAPRDGSLWDAVGFSPARQEVAARGDLLELLVMYTFVTGSAMVIRSDLRELASPIPTGWVHDAWIAMLGAFVRPYRMMPERLMAYRLHEGQEIGVPEIPMPDDTWRTRWKLRIGQVPDWRNSDLYRQRRRIQAQLYGGIAERFGEAAERYLRVHGGTPHARASHALDELRERSAHLSIRGNLPDRRLRRAPVIWGEVRKGRYRRYSAGVFSAVQDLVY